MAGHSEKKLAKQKTSTLNTTKIAILGVSSISSLLILYNNLDSLFYGIFIIILLSGINYVLYRFIDTLYESMFFNPLVDLLAINLTVMLGINFHYKFWFLYMIVPAYGVYKGAIWAYNHVKGVDSDETPEEETPKGKEKQKKKIIKH